MPDIEYRIRTTSDPSGVKRHTDAVRADIQAVQQAKSAYEGLADAQSALETARQLTGKSSGKKDEFVIRTEAEYAAIQKTLEAAQRKIPVMQALGTSTAALEAQIQKLDAALSTEQAITIGLTRDERALQAAREAQFQSAMEDYEKLAKAQVQASASTYSLAEAKRILGNRMQTTRGHVQQLRATMSPLVSEVMPGFSGVLGSTLTHGIKPWVIGITAVTAVVMALKNEIKAINAVTDAMAKDMDTALNNFQRIHDSMVQSRIEAARYWRELRLVATAHRSVADQAERYVKIAKEHNRAIETVADAKKSADIAKIEATEKDPVQKELKLLALEEKNAQAKQKRADEESRREVEALKNRQFGERVAVEALASRASEQEQAARKAKEELDTYKAHKAELKEIQDKMEEITKDRDSQGFSMIPGAKQKYETRLEGLRTRQQFLQEYFRDRAGVNVDTLESRAAVAQDEAQRTKSLLSGAVARLKELDDTITDSIRRIKEDANARAQANRQETRVRLYEAIADFKKQRDELVKENSKLVKETGAVDPGYGGKIKDLDLVITGLTKAVTDIEKRPPAQSVLFPQEAARGAQTQIEIARLRGQVEAGEARQRLLINTPDADPQLKYQQGQDLNRMRDQLTKAEERLRALSESGRLPMYSGDLSGALEQYHTKIVDGFTGVFATIKGLEANLNTKLAELQKQIQSN